jgi:iron complex outermembrane receptor protein
MNKKVTRCSPLLGCMLANLVSPGAMAQTQSSSLVLEEVIVTARKREERLQDVAVAVSAISGKAIDDAHIRNSADLTQLVPSLTLGSGGGESFVIRGIGTQAFSGGVEPSVSTMIDGVVLGRSSQSFMQLVDIQRVEVLRGPQGTLFGKNSSSGVVHFITRDPSDEPEGTLRASAIDRDEYRLGATVSGPVSDNLGLRLTYGGVRDDGYIENVYNSDDLGGGDTDTVRFKARWTPAPDLDLKWSSDYAKEDDTNRISTLRVVQDPAIAEEVLPVVASKDNYRVNLNGDISNDIKTWGHSLEINWDLSGHTLTSISGYRKFEKDAITDNDDRPTDPRAFTSQSQSNDQDQYTQELRINSPGDDRLRYVSGLYLFLQSLDQQLTRTIAGSVSMSDYTVDTTNYAAFGEVTYDITESVRGLAGGRYTYDELKYKFQRESAIWGTVNPPFKDDNDDTNFSGKLTLEWDMLEDAMLYGSFTQGYKGQAYNVTFGTTPPLESVDPEKSNSWEVGLKSMLFDSRLILNGALFLTDYDDFQGQTQIDDGDNTAFFLTNAGEVRTQGLELDFTALATQNLSLNGGLSLIDATIEDFKSGPCSQGQKFSGACPNGDQDLSDGDLPFSPDWKVILNANYLIPLDGLPFDLVAKAAYRGQDDVLMDITQDKGTVQSGYSVFDLSMTLESNEEHWDATLYVKNVADKHYASGIFSNQISFNPGGYSQRLPKVSRRTTGLEVRYSWF